MSHTTPLINLSNADRTAINANFAALNAKIDAAIAGDGGVGSAPLNSPALTGNPTAPTPTPGSNSASIATTAFVQNAMGAKASLASPVFTGNPQAPTPAPGDNDTSIATTAFVAAAVAAGGGGGGGGAPLNSPAFTGNPTAPTPTAGDNDNSIATTSFVQTAVATVQTAVNAKAPLASPVFTGNPTAPTPAPGDSDTSIATTGFVTAAISGKAPLASPVFTGNPTAPTPTPGDNDTSLATTAFVTAAIAALGGGGGGSAILSTVDVRSYGAVCDGSANDTTPLNNAIAAAISLGKAVVISSGTLMADPITISTDNVILIIAEGATLKLRAAAGAHQILVLANGFKVYGGGTIDGNRANNTADIAGIFVGSGFSGTFIDRINFRSHNRHHIRVKGGTGPASPNGNITRCTFSSCGDFAVYGNWEAPFWLIANNRFYGGDSNAIWWGEGSHHCVFEGNFISDYGRMGIEIFQAGDGTKVISNHIQKTVEFGLSIDTGDGIIVTGNTIERDPTNTFQSLGLELVKLANFTATGNRMKGWAVGGSIDQSSDGTYTGNVITSSVDGAFGLYVTTQSAVPARRNVISGNKITLTGAGGLRGIWLQTNNTPDADATDNTFEGNSLFGPGPGNGEAFKLNQDSGTQAGYAIRNNTIRSWGTIYQGSQGVQRREIAFNKASDYSVEFDNVEVLNCRFSQPGHFIGFLDVNDGAAFGAGETRSYSSVVPAAKTYMRVAVHPHSGYPGDAFWYRAFSTADDQVTLFVTNVSAGAATLPNSGWIFTLD